MAGSFFFLDSSVVWYKFGFHWWIMSMECGQWVYDKNSESPVGCPKPLLPSDKANDEWKYYFAWIKISIWIGCKAEWPSIKLVLFTITVSFNETKSYHRNANFRNEIHSSFGPAVSDHSNKSHWINNSNFNRNNKQIVYPSAYVQLLISKYFFFFSNLFFLATLARSMRVYDNSACAS